MTQTDAERFWANVNKTEGCWLWAASKMTRGYGQFYPSNSGHQNVGAHRYAWQLENGPIPERLLVLHKCDVRDCVNPSHLFLGTNHDNTMDAVKKGRVGDRGWSYDDGKTGRCHGCGKSRCAKPKESCPPQHQKHYQNFLAYKRKQRREQR
jgi:hypothetical protein